MTHRAAVVAVSCFMIAFSWAAPSLARDGDDHVDTGAGGSVFLVTGSAGVSGQNNLAAPTVVESVGVWHHVSACDAGGSSTCHDFMRCGDGSPLVHWWLTGPDGQTLSEYYSCPQTAVTVVPQVTSSAVFRALRRIGLPASELVVQPPGGETLVNFDTNF